MMKVHYIWIFTPLYNATSISLQNFSIIKHFQFSQSFEMFVLYRPNFHYKCSQYPKAKKKILIHLIRLSDFIWAYEHILGIVKCVTKHLLFCKLFHDKNIIIHWMKMISNHLFRFMPSIYIVNTWPACDVLWNLINHS